jgi:hypothetical protein
LFVLGLVSVRFSVCPLRTLCASALSVSFALCFFLFFLLSRFLSRTFFERFDLVFMVLVKHVFKKKKKKKKKNASRAADDHMPPRSKTAKATNLDILPESRAGRTQARGTLPRIFPPNEPPTNSTGKRTRDNSPLSPDLRPRRRTSFISSPPSPVTQAEGLQLTIDGHELDVEAENRSGSGPSTPKPHPAPTLPPLPSSPHLPTSTPQDHKDAFFSDISSAIKSSAEKAASSYHEDAYLAFVLLIQKIFQEVHCATSNRAYMDNSPDFVQMKEGLLEAAETLVSNLKAREGSLPGSSASMHAPSSDPLTALKETLQAFDRRLTKIEGGLTPSHLPPPVATASAPSSQGSYARAVSGSPSSPSGAPKSQLRGPPAKSVHATNAKAKVLPETENVRIVIRCSRAPKSSNPSTRLPPRTIADRVNAIAAKADPSVFPKVIGVNWNRSNNIILTYPSGTNAAYLADFIKQHGVCEALGIPTDTLISEDVPWSKIMITHVPTGFGDESGVFSDTEVAETFKSSNEWTKNIRFAQQPRWLKKPESINKVLSSIVTSFDDPDGSIV